MARIRSIKPSFWEDDKIGSLSRDARLLFVGSWNLADDEGRLRWSPENIKASLFSFDRDLNVTKVAKLMAEIEREGLVVVYTPPRFASPLSVVVNFGRHQKINRPQPSHLPPPPSMNGSVSHSLNSSMNQSGTGSPQGATDDDVSESLTNSLGEWKGMEVEPPLAPPPTVKPGRRKPRSAAPATFEITPDLLKWAAEHAPGLDLDRETAMCLEHFRSTGELKADWTATWRKWLLKAVAIAEERASTRRSKGEEVPWWEAP